MPLTRAQAYTEAGVNIDAGNSLVSRIKSIVSDPIHGVLSDIGGFGGLFKPDMSGMAEPVLVASTDGVGTKLKLAFAFDKHDTVGIDLVAMSANDILVQGARPLLFLDYFATGKLDVDKTTQVIAGIAEGCKQAGCALLGGETAEMPDMYADGEYDLAGFCVGMADNAKIVDGSGIRVGDVLIGLASSGIHSNGYSLVRKILDKSGLGPDDTMPGSDRTVKDVLLEPTYIYSDVVRNLMRDLPVKGMVHITGGGFYDNIPRVLPNSVTADIKFASWDVAVSIGCEEGGLTWPEMLQIFNCGIGYVFIVPSEVAEEAMGRLEAMHKGAWVIGTIGRRQDKDEEQVKILF
ncbi:MAG: phosphoribosylformylglycinamidine cyclo-ligase [Bilophila wadsworthia]